MSSALTFDEERHEYALAGVPLLSVTTALGLAGIADYSAIDAERLARRAAEGSAVHLACELLDQDDLAEPREGGRLAGFVAAYRRFKDETGFVPDRIEARVHHPVYLYAGTLDRTGSLRGQRVLIDLKTSTAPQEWWGYQLAAYELCLDDGPYDRFALRLAADGKYRLDPFRDPNDRKLWLAALVVAQWRRSRGKG